MLILRLFGLLFLLSLLGACSVSPVPHIVDVSRSRQPARKTDLSNDKILRKNYCSELFLAEGFDATSGKKGKWLSEDDAVYRKAYDLCLNSVDDKHSFPTPNLGLALSGGGTRSGSFAIGVLKALDDISTPSGESLLRQVDAISSVSGGGYAAYWYLMQNYYRDPVQADCCQELKRDNINKVQKDIFRTEGDIGPTGATTKYQDHLAASSDLIFAYDNPLMHPIEDVWNFGGQIITMPVHWLSNGVMDWRFNCSAAPLAYKQGIERTYGLSVRDSYSPYLDNCHGASCKYYNARRGYFAWFNDEAQADAVSFSQYRDFLRSSNSRIHTHNEDPAAAYIHPLPLPIINTTQGFGDKKLQEIDDAVFTFTPLSYGSGLGDYVNDSDKAAALSMSKAYAISGAAADANARESGVVLDSVLWISNSNLGYRYPNRNRTIDRVSFTALKVLHYLSPIGLYHLENAFTKDAFRPYYRLSDGGQSENLGFYSLIKRAARHVIVMDAEQDNNYRFDALRRVTKNVSREMGLKIVLDDAAALKGRFKNGRKPAPVFSGKVKGLNNPDGTSRDIDFLYLKLALDRDTYSKVRKDLDYQCSTIGKIGKTAYNDKSEVTLPCSVVDYIRSEPADKKAKFPHNSTADIFYDEAQFNAFRDFGYYLTMTKLYPRLKQDGGWLADLERYRTARFVFFNNLVNDAKMSTEGSN